MEQSAIEPSLTAIEVEVVEFMESLRLSRLHGDPPPTRRLPFSWGNKRRRSAIDRSPSPPPPPAQKVKLSSPATTLAFPPSESEGNLSNPITSSKLPKKIENLHKLCDSLSSQEQALLQEIAKVRSYFDKLKEEQLHLKERLRVEKEKQQLCLELEPPATAMRLNLSMSQHAVPYIVRHQQPLVAGVECTSVAKGGLFDLNVLPAEEARWLGMAAQARLNRKKRKEKIQQRNNECATKFRVVR